MSAIAEVLLARGYRVSGSDIVENGNLMRLRKAGAVVLIGHSENNIPDCDAVIVSTAVSEHNSEISAARARGIPVMHRSDLLHEICRESCSIAVAGTHGKTTTTNMLAHVLTYAQYSPSVILGGISLNFNSNAQIGKSDYFIYEADESDGTLLTYTPQYSVITNIEEDHIGYYNSLQEICDVFSSFMDNTSSIKNVYCCLDCPNVRHLVEGKNGCVSYSAEGVADVYATDIVTSDTYSSFNVIYYGHILGEILLSLAGMHNVSNALPVIACALDLGITFDIIQKALASHQGTSRRMETLFDAEGVKVIDDYAHHPTEVRVTLSAIKKETFGRTIVVFQPHRYSRLTYFFDDFVSAFSGADMVFISDVYSAGEEPVNEINSQSLCTAMAKAGDNNVTYRAAIDEIVNELQSIVQEGDLIIFMGAGDSTKHARRYAGMLDEKFRPCVASTA